MTTGTARCSKHFFENLQLLNDRTFNLDAPLITQHSFPKDLKCRAASVLPSIHISEAWHGRPDPFSPERRSLLRKRRLDPERVQLRGGKDLADEH